MITAINTSVLLDVFAADPQHLARSQSALRKCRREGRLILCDVVLAELRPCFSSDAVLLQALETIEVDYTPVSSEAALLAGATWAAYREAGGLRERLVPDFLIAAHARLQAERFLTRDRGFYKKWFKGLRLEEP